MEYKIRSGSWRHYGAGDNITPLDYCGDVVVAIDPGKTNMAMTVGDPYGVPLSYVEITGKGTDTTDYCSDFVEFIVAYLSNTHPIVFGEEAAVSYKGMEYHRSQMVLTEIRANLLQMIKVRFGCKPIEINNWTWKHAILPEGYRSTSEKGSLRYLTELGLRDVTHDVTDSICMYMYLQRTYTKDYPPPKCVKSEICLHEYSAAICDANMDLSAHKKYEYNPQFSLRENISYCINRAARIGYFELPSSYLTLDEVYSCSSMVSSPTERLKVMFSRIS